MDCHGGGICPGNWPQGQGFHYYADKLYRNDASVLAEDAQSEQCDEEGRNLGSASGNGYGKQFSFEQSVSARDRKSVV